MIIGRLLLLFLLPTLYLGLTGCESGKSQAYDAYVRLMSAQVEGECEKMYALVDGEAKSYVDKLCTPRTTTVLGQEVNLGSVESNIAAIAPAHTPLTSRIKFEREIESETISDDGSEVDLVVIEKSYEHWFSNWEPSWWMKHTVAARKIDGHWKITKFSEEVLREYINPNNAHPAPDDYITPDGASHAP